MSKDWTGMKNANIRTLCSSTFAHNEREIHDYYATDPKAAELLCDLVDLRNVWECAAGEGHLAKVFERRGILGRKSDIIDRTGDTEVFNFLVDKGEQWNGDIVTNPPYKYATQFIVNAINAVGCGDKVAMFLPVRYLEGKQRKMLFAKYPPRYVYVSSSRIKCALNGVFDNAHSITSYCWVVWEKGYHGETILRWFN